MATIRVELGVDDHRYIGQFEGRWLVEPDPDMTRMGNTYDDPGAYYGIAVTDGGHIAVYRAHVDDAWAPTLGVYDTLEDAAEDNTAAVLIAIAGYKLREEKDFFVRMDV